MNKKYIISDCNKYDIHFILKSCWDSESFDCMFKALFRITSNKIKMRDIALSIQEYAMHAYGIDVDAELIIILI